MWGLEVLGLGGFLSRMWAKVAVYSSEQSNTVGGRLGVKVLPGLPRPPSTITKKELEAVQGKAMAGKEYSVSSRQR